MQNLHDFDLSNAFQNQALRNSRFRLAGRENPSASGNPLHRGTRSQSTNLLGVDKGKVQQKNRVNSQEILRNSQSS